MVNQNPWEEVIVESQVWRPEDLGIGSEIIGIYKGKEENVGQWQKNRYTLAIMVNGECQEKYVYGTVDLDEKFKQVPIGYEVKIIFEKELPSRPPKKPFKKFKVYKRPVDSSEPETSEKDVTVDSDDNMDAGELISKITDHLLNGKGFSAEDITDDMLKKEAGLWYGKERITKNEYESLLDQLERKHIKE